MTAPEPIMMDNTTQTAAQAIDALASKLAVPATHLWAVLVRQVPINAAIQVGYLTIAAVVTWLTYRFARAHWYDETDDRNYDADGDLRRLLLSAVLVVLGLWLIIQGASVIEALGYLANPEYFALQQVLMAVGK